MVLGAGIAGLVTARVLSEHYGEVVVVERDELPVGGGLPIPTGIAELRDFADRMTAPVVAEAPRRVTALLETWFARHANGM